MVRLLSFVLLSIIVIQVYSGNLSGWPAEIEEIRYFCSGDSSYQPALYYCPDSDEPKSLLVALHTWSGDYTQETSIPYSEWCINNNWIFIHPDFRGISNKQEATGSSLAIEDVRDAVKWIRDSCNVDSARIYMVGSSWGASTALLVASHFPKIWAAVSVWVPIVDLKLWYFEGLERKNKYPAMIDSSCGGKPGESEEIDRQYKIRSPQTHLFKAKNVSIDLNAGIYDGLEGSVPVHHSIRAFNILADSEDRIIKEYESFIVDNFSIPEVLQENIIDTSYGKRIPLLRRESGNIRLTIFKGSHEIILDAAMKWLSSQQKKKF
jgi:alpha/beta superfamily hydrolase